MFTDVQLQYRLNRLRHDELVRAAERERLARQIHAPAAQTADVPRTAPFASRATTLGTCAG